MNPRTTGILLIAAAALGAFVWLYEIEGEERRAEAEAEAKRLFPGIEAEDVSAVELATREGGSARLERTQTGWTLVLPLRFPADAFAADGLASNLAGLASEAVLEDPQPPEEYGLGESARVVRFQADGEERVLRLGSKTPMGSNTYARVEGEPEIVTVATFRAQSFDKSLTDLRERRILDFDPKSVLRVEARWPGGGVTLARAAPAEDAEEPDAEEPAEDAEAEPGLAATDWRLESPLAGRADDEVVERLLQDLSFLRADGFVDDPSEELLAGFEEPAYEIVLHGTPAEDGEAPRWRFVLGPVHGGDKRLVRGAERSLYTIPSERASDFPAELVAYRFKTLADFRIADAQQLDLFFHPAEGDPVAIHAERSGDGWSSSPEALAPAKAARIVSELSRLAAQGILAEQVGPEELASLGLAPPNTILSVFGEPPEDADAESVGSPPRLAEVHIGNVEGSEWILARAAGDPTVYRLSYELAEHVPVGLEAFRNRFLAEEQPPAEPAAEGEGVNLEELLSPSEESP